MNDSNPNWPVAAPESEWTPYQRAYMHSDAVAAIRLKQQARIRRWATRQRRDGHWVSLDHLADWCARVHGSVARSQELWSQAWKDIARSIIAGEFTRRDPHGERCLYIVFVPPKNWGVANPTQFRVGVQMILRDFGNGVLGNCWVPADLAARWLRARGLVLMPGMAMPPDPAPLGSAAPVREAAPKPTPLPPFNAYEAEALLRGLKVAKGTRPSREATQTFLAARFAGVSRDKADGILRKVWGSGRRGPKSPQRGRK